MTLLRIEIIESALDVIQLICELSDTIQNVYLGLRMLPLLRKYGAKIEFCQGRFVLDSGRDIELLAILKAHSVRSDWAFFKFNGGVALASLLIFQGASQAVFSQLDLTVPFVAAAQVVQSQALELSNLEAIKGLQQRKDLLE